MKTKKLICALMCALLLVTAVVPVFADGGRPINNSGSYNETLSSIGVQAFYSCSFYMNSATGSITLSYLSDPSNHLPANDYTTYVKFKLTDIKGEITEFTPLVYGHMTYSKTIQTASGENITHAQYRFYVNGSKKHTINLGF